MCGCEPGFTCTRCRDTPDDPRYHALGDVWTDDERAEIFAMMEVESDGR